MALSYFGTSISKGYTSKVRRRMDQMISQARADGMEANYLSQLQKYRDHFVKHDGSMWIDRVDGTLNTEAFAQIHSTWYSPSMVKARQEKAAAEKAAAEKAAALERQRQELARLQTYQSNVGHGDLTGPGTPPTVISGGSQNVDASRLDIGRSSTARRRRGRGISAQLGL